ncbi:MAG: DUF3108 domain-containing protein [Caldimonas sp.]
MLDPKAIAAARSRQRRTWSGVVAVVLLGHAVLLGGVDALPTGAGRDVVGAPMTVRTIAATPVEVAPAEAPADAVPEPFVAPMPRPAPRPRPLRAAREPAREVVHEPAGTAESPSSGAEVAAAASSASASEPPSTMPEQELERPSTSTMAAASEPLVPRLDGSAVAPAADAAVDTGVSTAVVSASAPGIAVQPLLAAGEQPPPVYRTQLPAPATLRYQVRSGFFRGTGEIRWRHDGDGYSLALEARIAGLTLLKLTSEGHIDAAGLAPVRFLDQRARRAPQAANFQREAGTITFSGPKTAWPLLAGTQDQLSWMIQLAAIAAAEPERLVEGGRITMVVVGARGDARVWTLRYAGLETVETAAGPVPAVKLVRDGSAYDRGYEVWLDPAHSYLPAHVTQRNAAGGSELDLLLQSIEPAS